MPEFKPGRPPNFDKIVKVFPMARGPLVIFSYAPYIYSPSLRPIDPSLIAHENIHIARQHKIGVEDWWDKYLTDFDFRFYEELLAHRAEYRVLSVNAKTFKQQCVALRIVAKKLAAPLYGRMINLSDAMQLLEAESVDEYEG